MAKIQFLRGSIIGLIVFFLSISLAAQEPDSTRNTIHFGGSVSVTNNGFSFVPTFSLGDPATIVDFSVRWKRFRFEPQFRYALEGIPWSFIFIWRYDLIKQDKFMFTLGTHLPALNFITVDVLKDGKMEEVIQARRFFPVFELAPSYQIREDIRVGLFYLYGRNAKELSTRNTHFLSLRVNFSDIPISKLFYLKVNPEFYYLAQDDKDGVYVAGGISLARRDFPFSLGTLFNKSISTDIEDTNFDWNISLIWAFGSDYVRE